MSGPQLPCWSCRPSLEAAIQGHQSVERCLPIPRNSQRKLVHQWLMLPSPSHLPVAEAARARSPFMAPHRHITLPIESSESVPYMPSGMCVIGPPWSPGTRSSTHGPLRSSRAGGRRRCRGCDIGEGACPVQSRGRRRGQQVACDNRERCARRSRRGERRWSSVLERTCQPRCGPRYTPGPPKPV